MTKRKRPLSKQQSFKMHIAKMHIRCLFSSRLYCRLRNCTGSCHKGSRALPPVGNLTLPQRLSLYLTYDYNSINSKKVNISAYLVALRTPMGSFLKRITSHTKSPRAIADIPKNASFIIASADGLKYSVPSSAYSKIASVIHITEAPQ